MIKKKVIRIGAIFFITTTIVFLNCSVIKGVENISNNENITLEITRKHNFIIDSPVKCYDDLNKMEQVSDFKFKVPDFIPEGNKVVAYQLRKLSEKCNVDEIFFENSNGNFSFQIFQGDPVECLKIIEKDKSKAIENTNIEVEKEPLNLNGIKGLNVSLTITFPDREIDNKKLLKYQNTNKYYVWKDNNLWYSLEYFSSSMSDEYSNSIVNLSQDTIFKIAKSIRFPEEIKNVNYIVNKNVSSESSVMNIYDEEDIEKARNLLQFNPKFPVKINENINMISSIVGISNKTNKETGRLNYELYNFYSNQNGSITFVQGNSSPNYDNIKKNGYSYDENGEIKVEKLCINNIEVFKYLPKTITPQVSYLWRDKDVYHTVTLFVNISNSDEIIKAFISSKQI